MQNIYVYVYYPVVDVQLLDGFDSRTRYRQLYENNIKLYRNIDNPVRLFVKNQDQKPLDMTNFDVIVDLVDDYNKATVASYTGIKINSAKGICEIIVAASDIQSIENRYYYFLVKRKHIGQDPKVAYIDDNYNVRIPVEVHEAYLPYNPQDLDLGLVSDPNEQNFYDLGGLSQ
jgi:hypothetical protein